MRVGLDGWKLSSSVNLILIFMSDFRREVAERAAERLANREEFANARHADWQRREAAKEAKAAKAAAKRVYQASVPERRAAAQRGDWNAFGAMPAGEGAAAAADGAPLTPRAQRRVLCTE